MVQLLVVLLVMNEDDSSICAGNNAAVAIGYNNVQATGIASQAYGSETVASGDYSHAEGLGTQALNEAEHAEGTYNKSNNIVGSDFIDLGLSVKWRNRNIGAETITSYGNYYAWGELETKTYYDWTDPNNVSQNYKYANGTYNKLTKYCNNSEYGNEGYTDSLITLEMIDDVAYQTNNSWRMPTKEECEELISCANEWVEDYEGSGVNGRVFYKTTITPATKSVDLYTMFDEEMQPTQAPTIITNTMWQTLSMYTEEELDAVLSGLTSGQITDIRTIIFKDAIGTLAEYGTDYTLTTKVADQSVSLFIPASGYKYQGQSNGVGSSCSLWSSSLDTGTPSRAWYPYFNSDTFDMYRNYRYYGLPVRPVLD